MRQGGSKEVLPEVDLPTSKIRTVDSKGRVRIGMALAGSQVIVEEGPSGVVVKAVPAHEAWLWENEAARDAVSKGLEQAASGQLSEFDQ